MDALKGTTIDDVEVDISLAKPQVDKLKKKMPMMRGMGRGGPRGGDYGGRGYGFSGGAYGGASRGGMRGGGGGGYGGGYTAAGYGYNNGGGSYAPRATASYAPTGAATYGQRPYDSYASYQAAAPPPAYYNDPYAGYSADYYGAGAGAHAGGGYAGVCFLEAAAAVQSIFFCAFQYGVAAAAGGGGGYAPAARGGGGFASARGMRRGAFNGMGRGFKRPNDAMGGPMPKRGGGGHGM